MRIWIYIQLKPIVDADNDEIMIVTLSLGNEFEIDSPNLLDDFYINEWKRQSFSLNLIILFH